jgi:DUF2075 family protein
VFEDLEIALVVPQQALRDTIAKVFDKTPGLSKDMVMTPREVVKSDKIYDLLIVDEAHRIKQRANQSAASMNTEFEQFNIKLFGADDLNITQVDWLRKMSKHQVFLVDAAQSVMPGDISRATLNSLKDEASAGNGKFRLTSQMRVLGGKDYIEFVDRFVHGHATPGNHQFGEYDLKFFDSFSDMYSELKKRESEVKLSRLLAGYGWRWVTKGKSDPNLFDIEIEGIKLPWNRKQLDWISSPTSPDEVGSIHTIQGYDLNYAGVIFGPEVKFNPVTNKIYFDRRNYFDTKGKENNKRRGIRYTDEDILDYVLNVYRVLLTRGIKGTYIYVVDPELRAFLGSVLQ